MIKEKSNTSLRNFDDEVKFKEYLYDLGVTYGDMENNWKFYVEFVDNKGATMVSYAIARTPISALRSIPELLKKTNLPIEDLDIIVRFAFHIQSDVSEYVTINSVISPYMYFKKQETDNHSEIVSPKTSE